MKRISSWREFNFNPVAASPDCAYPLSTHQSYEPPRWLSQPVSFGHHLPKFTMRCGPQRDLFCSSHGDYRIPCNLGIFPFPVCEVIHIATVMHYELCKPSVCVLWLDPLTEARTVNGQDFCFSSFTPMWDLLLVHHRPQGTRSIYLFTTLGLHAICYFSPLCFCLQFIVSSGPLITVKCC